jgi:cytochrome c oxidase subunit 2
MLGDVVVLSEQDFDRWISRPDGPVAEMIPGRDHANELGAEPTFSAERRRALVSEGEQAAAQLGCLRCHSIDGTPFIGPTWTGLFGSRVPLTTGTTVLADEAYLTESMMDPMAKIVAGFTPVMPSYQGRMDPAQTAAIVEFMKTLKFSGPRAQQPNPQPVGGVPGVGGVTHD